MVVSRTIRCLPIWRATHLNRLPRSSYKLRPFAPTFSTSSPKSDNNLEIYPKGTKRNPYRSLLPALHFSEEVEQGRKDDAPIVALESTIYTHGFPYPDNVDLALGLEQVVRDNGGVPATIGVIDGEICVGMTKDQLIRLASAAGKPETMKISRRDIPYITGMVS
jgi:pseudouridine-5'-phosphate glycosidase/pseudouridine kinase